MPLNLGFNPSSTLAVLAASNAAASMPGIIAARHSRLARKLSSMQAVDFASTTVPSFAAIGNSVAAGVGGTTFGDTWLWKLAVSMQTRFAVGSYSDFQPVSYGVGSSTIVNAAAYAARSPSSSAAGPGRPPLAAKDCVILISIRNSTSALSVASYTYWLRATIRSLIDAGTDVIMVSETPRINTTTGAILDNASNWTPWLDAAKRVCAEEGASFVDLWSYCAALSAAGTNLLTYSTDGVHPNDAGHTLMAQLIDQCMVTPVAPSRAGDDYRRGIHGTKLVADYSPSGGTIALTAFTNSESFTARRLILAEGSAQAWALNAGEYISFTAPGPVYGFIVTLVGGAGKTGTATVQYAFQNAATGLAVETAYARENTYSVRYYGPGGNQFGKMSLLSVSAVGGPIMVGGITWLVAGQQTPLDIWRHSTETGTWSASTMTGSLPARTSSTVGDSVVVNFYGSALSLRYQKGGSQGKFTYSLDGGAATTIDAFHNVPDYASPELQVVDNATEAWHTLTITVATKNASSGANTVKIGELRSFSSAASPQTQIVPLAAGAAFNLPVEWKRAAIERVISGSPTTELFLPGASSISLGGTGDALVRLER